MPGPSKPPPMRYAYYNPNPAQKSVGDCTVRAISRALGQSRAQNETGQYLTPDLRGRFLLGASASHAAGSTGGEETHTLTVEEMPNITGQFEERATTEAANIVGTQGAFSRKVSATDAISIPLDSGKREYREIVIFSMGDGNSFDIMPPYCAVSIQIRAKVEVIQARLPTAPMR